MKKTLNRSKLGLNKDSVRKIADERLAEVIGGNAGAGGGGGGYLPTTSATCGQYTIMRDGTGTCK